MRRIIIWTIATLVLVVTPQDIYAQGFLKRMKEKAGNAMDKFINNAVEKTLGIESEQEEEPQINNDEGAQITTTASATDKLPKLRQTSLVWDAEVLPSNASTAEGLLQELPPLPTVAELVNPTESARERYYNKIVAVDLRVDELDASWACSEEEMLAQREKMYLELVDILGLSVEEQKRLDNPATTSAERAALEEKMKKHLIGDIDTVAMKNAIANNESKIEELSKEVEILSKKEENGTITPAERQRMMEIGFELMQIQGEVMQSVNFDKIVESTSKMGALASKYDIATQQLLQNVEQYSSDVNNIAARDASVVKSCDEIAAEYETELRAIYDKIFLTDDAETIHSLYDQAESMVKNYRERAAKIYLQGLQTRLNQAKELYPESVKLYEEMAQSGIIPQCATRRASLNLVRMCVDILNDTYEYFPQPDVMPFKIEPLNIGCFKDGDELRMAESGFPVVFSSSTTTSVEELFLSQSEISVYNESENNYYKIVNGKRELDDPEKPTDFRTQKAGKVKSKTDSFYGEIPLRKSGRKVVFDKGNCLILHDGTLVYPLAAIKYNDRIEFITRDNFGESGSKEVMFVKCTYKL